jgi:phosphoenolpyruvate---glycerone phosphotransferase subunit DhaL
VKYINNSDARIIVDNLIDTIVNNAVYLSEIDGAIGDGDHGVNMRKGFVLCKERMANNQFNLTSALKLLAQILLTEIGGSIGPLYGTFFKEMAKTAGNHEQIDAFLFSEMLQSAVLAVGNVGNARQGDKTMMDTLIPAIEANKAALVKGMHFDEALFSLKEAAERGMKSTKDMVAKIGRASRLGERSRGVLDAGAVSSWLILESISNTVIDILNSQL